MGLSRRKFTKEFKEAALRRLDLGASIAEVARACEVNPNLLHRWRKEVREHGMKAFPGMGTVRTDVAAKPDPIVGRTVKQRAVAA